MDRGMQQEKEVQHVYLVGAKSLGAYGGYETFVYKLTEYHQNKQNIKYHVACKANGDYDCCYCFVGISNIFGGLLCNGASIVYLYCMCMVRFSKYKFQTGAYLVPLDIPDICFT